MNSKFLKICEKVRKHLNEQIENTPNDPQNQFGDQPITQNTSTSEQDSELTTNNSSSLPIATNEEIASVLIGLKNFYSQKKELTQDEINELIGLPTDTSDSNIKKIINTFDNIFSTTKVDTNPKNIENSNFSS